MKFRKSILIYAAGIVTGAGALAVGGGFAVDSSVPYTFEDGQVISADVMNDLFAKIKNTSVGFENVAELNGLWNCNQYDVGGSTTPGFPSGNFVLNATTGVFEGTNTWTFTTAGGATTLTTTQYLVGAATSSQNNVGTCASNTGNTSYDYSVTLAEGYLLLGKKTMLAGCVTTPTALQIQKVSPYKFKYPTRDGFGICVKNAQPPAIPSGLTIATGTLSWTDNSSDETGFAVMKKSTGGSWTEIGTVAANVTTYTDSTSASGDKYRVKARGANGDSLGSNVVRVP